MEQAFTYMFKDNMFKQKFMFYFIFSFLIMAVNNYYSIQESMTFNESLLCGVVALIGTIFLNGYFYRCVSALIEQNKNYVLPHFEFGSNFLVGIKAIFAYIILYIPFFLIALIPSLTIISIFSAANLIILGIIPVVLYIIVLMLAFTAIMPALIRIFAKTRALSSFLQFKKAYTLIKLNCKRYFINLALIFAVGFIFAFPSSIGGMLMALSKSMPVLIINSVIFGIIASYIAFVTAFLTAKAIEREE